MRQGSEGYTILELLVTLTILSLATTVSLGLFTVNRFEKPSMALAKQLESAFVNARVQALTHNSPVTVILKLGDRFEVMIDGKVLFADTLQNVSVVATSGKLESDNTGISRFVFYPNGTSTGGSIAIKSQQIQTLLQLNWFTGQTEMSVSRLHNSKSENQNGGY